MIKIIGRFDTEQQAITAKDETKNPKLILKWNNELNCYCDGSGNVWVKDLEPGYKLREQLKDAGFEIDKLKQRLHSTIGCLEALLYLHHDKDDTVTSDDPKEIQNAAELIFNERNY